MKYTTQYYQDLYKNKFMGCVSNPDNLVKAVRGRYNADNLTIQEIFDAFDENGKLKKPVAKFIGSDFSRFHSYFAPLGETFSPKEDQRDKICDRDRFLLDAINMEVQATITEEMCENGMFEQDITITHIKDHFPDLPEFLKSYTEKSNFGGDKKSSIPVEIQALPLAAQAYLKEKISYPVNNEIQISLTNRVFLLTSDNQIKLNENIFIKWQLKKLEIYEIFTKSIFKQNKNIEVKFNEFKEKAEKDFNCLQNGFPKALETIHETIAEEINKLVDKKIARKIAFKNQLFYLQLDENFSNRIKKARESNKNGDELERIFNKLPINDPSYNSFITSFFKKHITNSKIGNDTLLKIIEKTTRDRGNKSSTKEAETGSIFDKKGNLALWVADELPENSRDAIGKFLKDIFAKSQEAVLTPQGELRKEFKHTIGQENYNKLVGMYGTHYVHNKIVNSMIMAMSGPLTSLPLKFHPSQSDIAFVSIASKLLDHERLYQQKQLQELALKKSENQPSRWRKFLQAVKRPSLETAAIVTSTTGGAAIGAIVGMLVGTFAFPGVGTGLGAVLGAAIGAGVGAFTSLGSVGLGRLFSISGVSRFFGATVTTGLSTGVGAGIGAVLGTFVFPGIGTGIGAAIGAGFGLAVGAGISGVAQVIKSQSNLGKILSLGLTGSATTAIGAGIGAILGTVIPIPGVATLTGILIGAGIGASVGALTTAIPVLTAYLMSGALRAIAQNKENLVETKQALRSNPYLNSHLARPTNFLEGKKKDQKVEENHLGNIKNQEVKKIDCGDKKNLEALEECNSITLMSKI